MNSHRSHRIFSSC